MATQRYTVTITLDTDNPKHGTSDYERLTNVAALLRTVSHNLDADDVREDYYFGADEVGTFRIDWLPGPISTTTPAPVTATGARCYLCNSPDVTASDNVVLTYKPVFVGGELVVRGTIDADRVAHLPDGTTRTIAEFYDEQIIVVDEDTTECLNCGRIGYVTEDDLVPAPVRKLTRYHVAYTGTDTDYEATGRHDPLDPDKLPDGTTETDGIVVGQYRGDVYLDAHSEDDAEGIVRGAASYPVRIDLVEEA